MSAARPPLPPEPGSRGLATGDPADVAALVSAAWDGMIALAGRVDLDAPSRLPGWSARAVLVHLGSWPEHTRFDQLVDDVRAGRTPEPEDTDARNALVVAAHADADADEIVGALAAARDRALAYLASPDAERLGRRLAESPVGPLPLTGVVAASAYELAVHALDVVPGDEADPSLLHAGVGALVDTTGALAARARLQVTFAVLTPGGGWACGVRGEHWTTMRLEALMPAAELGWPGLHGTAADVLDAAAGRRPAVQLVLSRRLRLHDVPGLMMLLPALETVPGLPGGAALRAAARTLATTGSVMGRLGSLLRG